MMKRALGAVLLASVGIALLAAPVAACTSYVVGSYPAGWPFEAVVEAQVVAVEEAHPGLVDRNPEGFDLLVTRVYSGDPPESFEVRRASGCDTMTMSRDDRVVIALGRGFGYGGTRPTEKEYPFEPNNYNSVFYRLEGDTATLVEGSAWLEPLPAVTTLAAVVALATGVPMTDAVSVELPDRMTSVLIAAITGVLAFGWAFSTIKSRSSAHPPV